MVLAIIVSFLGLIAGLIVAKAAKEEIKPGRKYFKVVIRVILFLLVVSFLFLSWTSLYVVVAFLVGLILARYFDRVYFYLGLGLAASVGSSENFFLLVNSLVFLFGLPYAGFIKLKEVYLDAIFFFIPLLLLLIPIVFSYEHLLLGFVSGALFYNVIKK